MNKKILIICAHADDHIICAGTVFKLQDQGYEVFEVLLTNSQEGLDKRNTKANDNHDVNIQLRKDEFDEATRFMGTKKKYVFNKEDLNLCFSKKIMLRVMQIIREVKPQIIFTMNEIDYHKDHITAAKIAKEASLWAATDIRPELGASHRTEMVLYGEGMLPIKADLLVDITGYQSKKSDLFKIYESQANSKSLDFIESLMKIRGYHIRRNSGVEFAEAYTLNRSFPSLLFN